MIDLLNMTFREMKDSLREIELPGSRANGLASWIYQKSALSFEEMSDLSKELRQTLSSRYRISSLRLLKTLKSSDHEAVKFLFETEDGEQIESVIIIAPGSKDDRFTLCVSSQVGCPLQCAFCATGQSGFTRDLTTAEIISQIIEAERYLKDEFGLPRNERALSNIVFMGMGEPLLNIDAVFKSIFILNFPKGYNMGWRHFTVSTAGVVPGIYRLAEELPQVRLAISLNTANPDKRKAIMPVSRKHILKKLISTIIDYQKVTNRRVTFEYILLQGFNDAEEDIVMLKRMLQGIKYNLNVIFFNETPDLPFQRTSESEANHFISLLEKHAIPFVVRKSKGQDIAAACGQLRGQKD